MTDPDPIGSNRPQPLTKASAIVTAVATLTAVAVMFGIVPAATGDAVMDAVNVSLPAVILLVGVIHTLVTHLTAQAKVTPVADPMALVLKRDPATGAAFYGLDPLVPASAIQAASAAPPADPPASQS